jgi:hypothetical protein
MNSVVTCFKNLGCGSAILSILFNVLGVILIFKPNDDTEDIKTNTNSNKNKIAGIILSIIGLVLLTISLTTIMIKKKE